MRRKDREIKNIEEIEEIIEKADVCRIALSDRDMPYIVTMNFGYRGGEKPALFLHCACEGKKIDIMKRNNRACFALDVDHKLVKTDSGCNFSMNYRSVVGTGRIFFIEKREEKIDALRILMKHYTGVDQHTFDEKKVDCTTVLRLEIDGMSGKKRLPV
jgi:nitroimidazol reductase NimA-like FMN-containing flavoprotein (pyridoxamine 5'-phosphate oxidase superfamily)